MSKWATAMSSAEAALHWVDSFEHRRGALRNACVGAVSDVDLWANAAINFMDAARAALRSTYDEISAEIAQDAKDILRSWVRTQVSPPYQYRSEDERALLAAGVVVLEMLKAKAMEDGDAPASG